MEEHSLEISKLFSVQDKEVIVTGGLKGIGLMITAAFIQNGANVYTFSRKPDFEVANKLNTLGKGRCKAFTCDINKVEDIENVVLEVSKLTDRIHCLVNNSGTVWAEPFETTPKASFDKILAVNITGLFICTQKFLSLLERAATKTDPARVINIASIDGLGVPNLEEYAYSASKAGVIHLTKVMSGFLLQKAITVNCISPGIFPSKMSAKTVKAVGEERVKMVVPMHRFGEPGEIASAVIFLASKGGAYTTGTNIVIDGGVLSKPRM